MADTGSPWQRFALKHFDQVSKLSLGTATFDVTIQQNCNTGAVVSPVFEPT
jgi:hypothetical protein